MTDDTLVNGLKAIFGTSAQGSAPASSALIPYMDASGNPVGLSSMANLASVLGVMKMGANIPKSADFNDYKTYGYYQFDTWNADVSGGSNYPFLSAFGLMLVYNLNTIALQACLDIDGGRIAIRKYTKQNQTWGGWFEFQHSS